MRPRGWKWPERKTTRVTDQADYGPTVVPIRPLEASRWPVAGCLVGIGLAIALVLGAWYLLIRLVARLATQIMNLG